MSKRQPKIPNSKCKICGKIFYIKPFHKKKGWGIYCSKNCQNEGQKTGEFISCDTCRKERWQTPREIKHSKSGKFFCGKSCQTIWRNRFYSEENHPFWRGGENIYRLILKRKGVKQICKGCGFKDKRVIIVHHRDRNRKNNKLGNLVWLCHNCHYLAHHHSGKF